MEKHPIPERTKLRFPEYDPKQLNLRDFKTLLIERILDSGTREEVRWLFSCYRREDIVDYLKTQGQRRLSNASLSFWLLFFDLPPAHRPKNPLWLA